jgi:hypothetical protein
MNLEEQLRIDSILKPEQIVVEIHQNSIVQKYHASKKYQAAFVP